jgi:hypothetical protein
MEIKQVIRRQYLVTFDEEEAQDVWAFLEGLQESDYEAPFKRSQVIEPERQAAIMKAMSNLRDSPSAQSSSCPTGNLPSDEKGCGGW